MKILPATAEVLRMETSHRLSAEGRERMLSVSGEPLFLADWERTLMIHYEVEPRAMQRELPFPLDLWNGRAFVSLVAFTMRGMRPRRGGRLARWLFKPVATHPFLNVRAYVRQDDEAGICFLAEWLPNRLSVMVGPSLYGLPYRFAHIDYLHAHKTGRLSGMVASTGRGGRLAYEATIAPGDEFQPSSAGSLDEFLLERYTAFNWRGVPRRFFRVWHPPWRQIPAQVSIHDDSLLLKAWPWFAGARLIGANYSPGLRDVWMGRAQVLK